MSAQWKCKKCGIGMHSKCPDQRSVFIEDISVVMLGNVVLVADHPRFSVMKVLTIMITPEEGDNPLVALKSGLANYTDEQLTQAICDHEWKIQHGECLFGCHKSRRKEPVS